MHSRPFKNQTEADRFYMSEAISVRRLSDDPKAAFAPQSAVGAVIADPSGEIMRSANVLPPRVRAAMTSVERISDADRYFLIEHAERAAIFQAWQLGRELAGATLYCTRFPCSDCARVIAWSDIRRLVVATGFSGEMRWLEAQRGALRILRNAGIVIRYLGKDSLLPARE